MKPQALRDPKMHQFPDRHRKPLERRYPALVADRTSAPRFSSERCARCGGFLVSEWCEDLYDVGGRMDSKMLRSVQCGHREDPLIIHNRMHSFISTPEEAGESGRDESALRSALSTA